MKVILLDDIKSIGKKGQVIEAADGYCRNFLFPRKLAVEATNANINELNLKQKSEEKKNQKVLEEAQELCKKIESAKVELKVRLGEGGKLFGSVTSKEIALYLEEQAGIKIDKKKINLPEPIKSIGIKEVDVKIHPKVTAKLKVSILEQQ